jgi:siroheme synthase-like protein
MAFFPVFIEWEDVPCLIAGGGPVAFHKAELLYSQGADVTVVAPTICPELQALPVRVHLRKVAKEDVSGKRLVVDATGDADTAMLLQRVCREQHIPFNSASRAEGGTAVFPAVYREGRTMLAVSGLGASPAASAMLRDLLAEHIPACMDEILDAMAELRTLSRDAFDNQPVRSQFLHRCLDEMMREQRALRPEEVLQIQHDMEENPIGGPSTEKKP